MTLYYNWGDDYHDDEYEYECDYTQKDIEDYIQSQFNISKEAFKRLEESGYFYAEALEEDDFFKEYLKEKYEKDAIAEAEDAAEYARDPWGYYGVSIHDFI